MTWWKVLLLSVGYAAFVVSFHGLGHYIGGNPESYKDAGVNAAGVAVGIAGAALGLVIAKYGDKVKKFVR